MHNRTPACTGPYWNRTTHEHKPQRVDTHTRIPCDCSLGTARHSQAVERAVTVWDRRVQSADREARQSNPDIKGPISNSAGRIHAKNKEIKRPSKGMNTHKHTHGQHFQCWLKSAFEVQQLCSSNLRGILLIRRAEEMQDSLDRVFFTSNTASNYCCRMKINNTAIEQKQGLQLLYIHKLPNENS